MPLSIESNMKSQFVTVKGSKFIDSEGRQIILHGVNIIDKSREHNYLSWHGSEEFAKMREWGFNCIRLGIIWDGVEPEPGCYDDEYLTGVDIRIQWAKENNIHVILDMHQDLFSAKFGGDGAPDWAVLDEGKPHIHTGPIWSSAYFTSPAVHTAFDNFWANKPARDGIGLQDHFARAWQHVAKRYADEPAVIGFDIFNEPFPGSSILKTMELKMKVLLDAIASKQDRESFSRAEIMRMLSRYDDDLIRYADDFEIYKTFVDAGASVSKEFESTVLSSFYTRVAEAIRQVDRNHILFLGTHILCNVGTPSGIMPILDPQGNRDPLQAFAPHGYDIVTDTTQIANANAERVKLIFERHAETARRLAMPVFIGEWGAFGDYPNTLNPAKIVVEQIEKHLFSDAYWNYWGRRIEETPYFPVIVRPYPAAVAGELILCKSDFDSRRISYIWRENPAITAPSLIYLPSQWFSKGYEVKLDPLGEGWSFKEVRESSGYLVIPPVGKSVDRRLEVSS